MLAAMTKALALLSFLFSATAFATLYGTDSRQLVRASALPSYQNAKATAIMIANTSIIDSVSSPGSKDIETDTLENNRSLCSSERFAKIQSVYVSCTGFLIAPDVLVTAGHCSLNFGEIRDGANPYCTDFSWYFDFEADINGKVKTTGIKSENIYACEKILHAAHTSVPLSENKIEFGNDFSIIKLKRPVLNRAPLKITTSRPQVGETISMIGHPLGSPKMMTAGRVLANEPMYIRATVSGFEGNSGSPVFNSKGEVFGILVRGYPDSLIDSKTQKDCRIVNRCAADGTRCLQDDNTQEPGDHIMPLGLIDKVKELGLAK